MHSLSLYFVLLTPFSGTFHSCSRQSIRWLLYLNSVPFAVIVSWALSYHINVSFINISKQKEYFRSNKVYPSFASTHRVSLSRQQFGTMLFDIYFSLRLLLGISPQAGNCKISNFDMTTHRGDDDGANSEKHITITQPKCIDHLSRCPSIHVNCILVSTNSPMLVRTWTFFLLSEKHFRPFSFFLCSTALEVKWISFVKCFKFQL